MGCEFHHFKYWSMVEITKNKPKPALVLGLPQGILRPNLTIFLNVDNDDFEIRAG